MCVPLPSEADRESFVVAFVCQNEMLVTDNNVLGISCMRVVRIHTHKCHKTSMDR